MSSPSITASELVAEARANIRETSPSGFHASPGDAVLIDVREPAEFETGHIPGHKERPIVVVCRTGGRAALAALSLQRLGFVDVRSIAGGVMAWGEAGLPLVVR